MDKLNAWTEQTRRFIRQHLLLSALFALLTGGLFFLYAIGRWAY